MTISERIFECLNDLSMTQKEFSKRTGIQQSTISEWKKNKTNPSSDKIMSICMVLGVRPEWLLSGSGPAGSRKDRQEYYIIDKGTGLGQLVGIYNDMDSSARQRLMGYAQALNDLEKGNVEKGGNAV